MKKEIGVTLNGHHVYVIINDSHMLAHASVTEKLLREAVSRIDYTSTFWMNEIDMGRVIGKDACVETTGVDDVRFEFRVGRKILSRVVYGREPEDTTILTVGLCTDDDGLVTVFTAFPGKKAPKELFDPYLTEKEKQEAEAFWACHALCVERG